MNEFKENLQRGAGRGGQDQEDNNDGKAKEDKKDEVNKEKKCHWTNLPGKKVLFSAFLYFVFSSGFISYGHKKCMNDG